MAQVLNDGGPILEARPVTSPTVRMTVGILLAAAAAVLAIVPTIAGISTWKVLLGLVGLALFIIAGRDRTG